MSDSYVPAALAYAAWAPLTAFAASLFVVWWLTTGRYSAVVLDHPQPRSLHETPVPRTGGLGVHAGLIIALGIISPRWPMAVWIAYAAVLLVSFVDDIRGLSPAWRFLVHLGASGLFAMTVLADHTSATVVIAALWCAWMANLYNFMDGSDGLAGGMAVSGFTFYGLAACLTGNLQFALINFSIAAAAMG